MRRSLLLALALLATLPLYAQSRRRAVSPTRLFPPPDLHLTIEAPWSVEITTTGGQGAGLGRDILVESAGKVTVGHFVENGRRCEFLLTPETTDEIYQIVANVRADLWFSSYIPANEDARCCDLVFTQVRLHRKERDERGVLWDSRYLTEFMPGAHRPFVPQDLIGLNQALYDKFDSYNNLCR